jgi:hypothetical protein
MTRQGIRETVSRLEAVIPQARYDMFEREGECPLVAANVTLKAVSQVMKFFPSGLVQLRRSLHFGVVDFS